MNLIVRKLQVNVSLQFTLYGGLLFFIIQLALARIAPTFEGHRWYGFWIMSLIGLTAGCAGWASGIVLSPIGSQVGGAQKVLAAFAVFWTGVVAGHLTQISSAIASFPMSALTQSTKIELLFGLGVFLFATCVTFNTRFSDDDISKDATP